jgi:hypothetical protein
MKKNKKFLSPNFMAEFKKWMDDHGEEKFEKGQVVFAAKPLKKIIETIDCIDSGEFTTFEVAKYFCKNGGSVKSFNENEVVIKNKKGVFILRPDYLKSEKD